MTTGVEMAQSRCKGCGRPIDWVDIGGRKVPLDIKVRTYRFDGNNWLVSDASASHFDVCPSPPKAETITTSSAAVDLSKHWWHE